MDIKKVLLLGGSGFIGTYIANRLSQRGGVTGAVCISKAI